MLLSPIANYLLIFILTFWLQATFTDMRETTLEIYFAVTGIASVMYFLSKTLQLSR